MERVSVDAPGGADLLRIELCAIPEPGPEEVLIKVAAAGVNRPDILQRQGVYPPPADASPTLGLEVAGEVVATGAKVIGWRAGDKVCALVNGGGYAQFALAPATQCLPIPAGLSLLEAVALPEACFTVWHNLFQRAKLTAGETLLVHGGSSGIGTTAIQMALALGVKVFATAGSPDKCRACERLGAQAINYRELDFVAEIKAKTQGRGADVILDMVGGDYVQANLAAAAKEGRIVNIAFLQGSRINVDLMPLMLKRLTLTGSTLRAQSTEQKALIAGALLTQVWPLIEQRKIQPQIFASFPLARVDEAHQLMESGRHIGKIILEVAHD